MDTANLEQAQPAVTRRLVPGFRGVLEQLFAAFGEHCPGDTAIFFPHPHPPELPPRFQVGKRVDYRGRSGCRTASWKL